MKNEEIISFFNQWKDDPRLYNDILATGCMERTRILCTDLMEKGYECGFIYMPQEEHKDECVSCVAQLKNGKNHTFKWMRHVVPFVWDEAGKIVVLDVCLMNGPESLDKWAKHILVNNEPVNFQNAYFNASDFLYILEYRTKNRNPWTALQGFCPQYQEMAIQPHQKKSKWLQVQNSISASLLNKARQR